MCENVQEAIEDLQQTLTFVQKAGDELGVDLYCAGTHPFAQWSSQLLAAGTGTRSSSRGPSGGDGRC